MRSRLHNADRGSDWPGKLFSHPAFEAAKRSGAPSVVLTGTEPRVAWANQAAAELFGTYGHEALQDVLMRQGSQPAKRMEHLARTGRFDTVPRLERLRVAHGGAVRSFTVLCACLDQDGEPALALTFLPSDGVMPTTPWSTGAQARLGGPTTPQNAQASQTEAEAFPMDAKEFGHTDLDGEAASSLDRARARLRSALGGAETARIAWQTDAAGCLLRVNHPLPDPFRVPLSAGSDPLTEIVARFDREAAGRLGAAMDSRVSWSGVEVLCPLGETGTALPLSLGATPWFDGSRRFAGFRGFARFDIADLVSSGPSPGSVSELASGSEPIAEAPHWAGIEAGQGAARSEPEASERHVGLPLPPLTDDGEHGHAAPPGGTSARLDRPANVVQLWPALAAAPARAPHRFEMPAETEGDRAGPTSYPAPDHADPDETAGAVPARTEAQSGLTSSEHLAFEEIGRTLASSPLPPAAQAEPHDLAAARGDPPEASDHDLMRHAAALVEYMSVGLLVMRDISALFANETLREELRFESYSELLGAISLAFGRKPPPQAPEVESVLPLPAAGGTVARFSGASRVIFWNGQPATLWTLSRLRDEDGQTPAAKRPATEGQPPGMELSPVTALADVAGVATAVIDGEGRIETLNRFAELRFGVESRYIQGESFTMLLAKESRSAASALLGQLKLDPADRAQVRGECFGRTDSDAPLPLEMRLGRLGADRFAAVWHHLAPAKASGREALRARRETDKAAEDQPDFLAQVNHQIRTPLNAILGFAEIMMEERFGTLGNPRYQGYAKDIHQSGTQVLNLLDGLADLSRVEAGRLDLDIDSVDVNKTIMDCVAQAHAAANRERVIVRTSFGPRLPSVRADERSLRQIIDNLLSNAVKFNVPGGQVIVSTAANEAGAVVVRIRDTGVGMSDADIASALEPFRQETTAKGGNGTRLGLPLTRALVGANGGSLSIRSRLGEGTLVEVTFQAGAATAAARVPA